MRVACSTGASGTCRRLFFFLRYSVAEYLEIDAFNDDIETPSFCAVRCHAYVTRGASLREVICYLHAYILLRRL